MKDKFTKVIATLFLFAIIGFSSSFTSAQIQENAIESGTRGAHEATHETSECRSGLKRYCHGEGTLCNKTMGWDCVIINE